MRYQYLLFILSLGLAFTAHSQDKFIEVMVTDTMWVMPNQFMYTVSVKDEPDALPDTAEVTHIDFLRQQMQENKRKQHLLDSLKTALVKLGYRVEPEPAEETYNTEYGPGFYSLLIVTSTTDSIKRLYDIIKNSSLFSGLISSRKSTMEDSLQQQLVARILAKAKVKASYIAGLGKLTLGNILSVKETPGQLEGWTAYPPLSNLENTVIPGWHTTLSPRLSFTDDDDNLTLKYQVKNTLTVRFAVQ